MRLRTVFFPVVDFSHTLPVVLVLLVGGLLYGNGWVTLGTVIAATLYLWQMVDPLDRVLQWAEQLQTKMDELFWDDERGGYFNSAVHDASIVLRLKEDYDGAEPAPSSVAAMNLLRLGGLGHDERWRERGRKTIDAFRGQ